MKRGKKAQVTVFIIISLVIILAVSIVLYTQYASNKENLSKEYFIQKGIQPSLTNIEDFSIDCLKENSIAALQTIGIQGGFYKKPAHYFELEWAFIPYYYDKGLFLMPTQEKIEEQLSLSVDENIKDCLEGINLVLFQLVQLVKCPEIRNYLDQLSFPEMQLLSCSF